MRAITAWQIVSVVAISKMSAQFNYFPMTTKGFILADDQIWRKTERAREREGREREREREREIFEVSLSMNNVPIDQWPVS